MTRHHRPRRSGDGAGGRSPAQSCMSFPRPSGLWIIPRPWSAAAALAFAAAWHLEWWLIVVAMPAYILALAMSERLDEIAVAHRVAAWALHAPAGVTKGVVLEEALAADLATAAVADRDVLEAGAVAAERTIDDPWLRSLAAERLLHARTLATAGGVPAGPRALGLLARPETTALAAAAVGALAVVAAMNHWKMGLVPLPIAIAVFAVGRAEAARRRDLPGLLSREASAPAIQGLVVMPEPAVVASLVSLASARPRVLARAARVVGEHRPNSDVALERLRVATRAVRTPRRAGSVSHWAAFAVVAMVLLQVL